ncbi:MAG: hypothetical protein U0931_08270 [Vulcanimicrobiota bacterium]
MTKPKAQPRTVRCVMEEHGYVAPVRRTEEHNQCFEAVRPNQMWHLDFLHRHINKQKVYVLLILDDFSASSWAELSGTVNVFPQFGRIFRQPSPAMASRRKC